ncbi:MAG: ABC transporter permease [Acidobacteriota bacterium]|jgi:putative ABC transport system permease protein|nr:ABC transporter permease [Acidobacteriota bacterium]
MENLITANIRSRPTRTCISILAVSLGVMIMLVIGGIVKGTLNEYLGRTVALGADFILQPPGSSVLYAFSDASLNSKLAGMLEETPGIEAVTPVLSKFSASHFGLVFGIDLPSYNRFPGRLQMLQGNPTLKGDEIVVDEIYADAKNVRLGTKINLLDHEFTVTGICRAGSIVRVFVPLETLQKLLSTTDKVTIMFAKAAPNANTDQVYQALRQKFPHYSLIRASDPNLLLAETPLPGLKEFRITLILISMALSFMVILLAMYTTIFERTREIGILKSLGASRRFIVAMILKESVMICCLGGLLGIVASEIIRKIITVKIPTLQVAMNFDDLIIGMVLGLIAGTLGALYPAYKAARMDPVRALSFE